ncbi:MAG: fibrobacter succinogenes major paralogous domain-containing protein [Bacteroidales bacterium]
MKSLKKIQIFITSILLLTSFSFGCKKDETTKENPVISWGNPADIRFGTLLSDIQLNATADVPGTFVYSPAIGTKLDEGASQELKVSFTPTDEAMYNAVSKSVNINVLAGSLSTAIFNTNVAYNIVTDIEGNVYNTIVIGTQIWMAENLRTTKFRNGDAIPEVTGNTDWKNLNSAAYCNYENTADAIKIATMGRLYNWFAVSNSRNIAPEGWHVATDADWIAMRTFLGGENIAGGKLKETGSKHWISPNTGATNSSGFTALPSGRREYDNGTFINNGYDGFWWTSSAYNPDYSWYYDLHYTFASINRANFHKQYGFSVRCVKD